MDDVLIAIPHPACRLWELVLSVASEVFLRGGVHGAELLSGFDCRDDGSVHVMAKGVDDILW